MRTLVGRFAAPWWLVAAWLVVLGGSQVVVFGEVWRFFVLRRHGQLLDTIALGGNTIGSDRVGGTVSTVLNAVSVVSVLVATGVVAFIALVRRRFVLGVVATLLIAGANLTAQLLKNRIVRPNLGVDPERAGAGNSLPSGHTTVAASVAVALVLVLPPRARPFAALVGAAYSAIVGVATMSAGWHRPSDSVAAILIVGGWAAAAGLALLLTHRVGPLVGQSDTAPASESHRFAVVLLGLLGAGLTGVALASLVFTDQVTVPPEMLSWSRLFVAYAGSAAGIAGAAALMMALVLSTVHRVVPDRSAAADAEPALVATSA